MDSNFQVVIVGGGLAGLTAAIHLLKFDIKVLVVEKNSYPKHKVCGEFISNEILPYFDYLKVDIEPLQPTKINKTVISTQTGDAIKSDLPLGGFGISRFALDNYLFQEVILRGGVVKQATVRDISFNDAIFTIQTSENQIFTSKIVLACFGKRTQLDIQMKRPFIQKKSPWLAVKAHYELPFESDLVALHNFEGGYCGVSKVENNRVNICYLVRFETFKNFKNIDAFQETIVFKNPHLKAIFQGAKPVFEKPLTISQISFEKKSQVENHILMLGDTAGLIHPLCGNGMAMAIHSAKIASELCIDFLNQKINRETFEISYQKKWNKTFQNRLRMGKWLSKILLNPTFTQILMTLLSKWQSGLGFIIKKTHGQKIEI
uniref:NAD(P)/FAD-dependent oxidoreductase n=1 Tax=Flavobacterium sp. TaxID=239 RepID=UPI00404A6C00